LQGFDGFCVIFLRSNYDEFPKKMLLKHILNLKSILNQARLGNAIHNRQSIKPESTAWYSKTQLTFSDLLSAVRHELGNINLLLHPEFAYQHDKNNSYFEDYLASTG
jgi:predicted nucleic-acid-binding protein